MKQDPLRRFYSSRVMMFSSLYKGRETLGGLPSELEKSLPGEEGLILMLSVMYDFSPRWLDIQERRDFSESPRSVLPDIYYEHK